MAVILLERTGMNVARWLVGAAALLAASGASAARLAVVVDAPADRAPGIMSALRARLASAGNELVDADAGGAALDDAALGALRGKLDVARIVAVTVQQQGKDRYLITVRADDAGAIARRYGEATGDSLAGVVVEVAGALPPLPPPPVAAAPASAPSTATPAAGEAPSAGDANAPPSDGAEPAPIATPHAASGDAPPRRRKHEYGLLVGGIVAFCVPWIATMGLAGNYLSYNPNAARLGFIPMVGPLLAKQKINDKDLKDGYDVGLTVDGAVQIVAAGVLVAGILYAAIGVPAHGDRADLPRWHPLVAVGPGGGSLGAEVTW